MAAVPSGAVPDAEEPASDPVDAEAPVSDDEVRDALPDDLDAAGYVGPYLFPNNNRRRVPGYLYLVRGGRAARDLAASPWATTPVLVNGGFLVAAVAARGHRRRTAWPPAGTSTSTSATPWSTPARRSASPWGTPRRRWAGGAGSAGRPGASCVYSAEDPPKQRGLVLVDGVDGEVVEWFVEDNPEDWSDLDGSLGADHR